MKYADVIKSVSYSQHEILSNIMRLYNDGKPFDCDMTYSAGKFYGFHKTEDGSMVDIPSPPLKFDVCPQTNDTVKIEPYGQLPMPDSSIHSLVIDLPFGIACGPSMNEPTCDENGKDLKRNREL